jgi:outer membrane receptor for ferrienterochelin and colicins
VFNSRLIIIGFLGCSFTLHAQDSLQSKQLDELVVTATRNERTMGSLPMPVTLVPQTQIRTMGSMRLNDVLTEQTGLTVVPQVNGAGNGLQLQGFNPDYTLILIDGEPLVGRFTGSLELSRIAVGNIKQIEIVKGPSSSLYGSDALAGVVNIITNRPQGTQGSLYARYGTNNTMDLTGDYGFKSEKVGLYVFGNRYSTDGYNLSNTDLGNTVSPFQNYTGTIKFTYQLGAKTDLTLSGRYFEEHQQFSNYVLTGSGDQKFLTAGTGKVNEWNFNPVVVHRFSNRLKMTARFYNTSYQTATHTNDVSADTVYYKDDFKQTFMRPELNAEYYFNDKNILTLGVGDAIEAVQTSRYGDEVRRQQQTRYFFFQDEITPIKRLSIIAGLRYDNNTVYGSQLSPKLSTRWEINNKLALKASFGVGFKSPDFRQQYYNFTNTAGGGYSVLGTEVIGDRLAQLESQGQIQAYLYDPAKVQALNPERSKSVNLGARATIVKKLTADVNLFYNSVDNMIDTRAIAITQASRTIFSYINIARTYTAGLESNFTFPVSPRLNFSLGYQLLYAKDKDVVQQVKDGGPAGYYRDPVTLETKRLKPSEYFGLYNRSRHMGNAKLFYSDVAKGFDASIRVIYRGKFGIGDIRGSDIPTSDINGNSILDTHDQFVNGYELVNISAAKTIRQGVRFQVGIDNLFNYTDPVYIPNVPGRLLYASIRYTFSKTH